MSGFSMSSQAFTVLSYTVLDSFVDDRKDLRRSRHVVPEKLLLVIGVDSSQ